MQGTGVQSLVGEQRSHIRQLGPHAAKPINKHFLKIYFPPHYKSNICSLSITGKTPKAPKRGIWTQQFCCLVVNTINTWCDLVFLCECKDMLFLNFPTHISPFKLTPYLPSPFLPHLVFWIRKRRIREGKC